MLTLALDTSQRKLALALLREQTLLAGRTDDTPDTANALLQNLDAILHETKTSLGDITKIIVGCGPGSFTSLRIGAASLWGLFGGLAQPPDVLGVSSLELRALGCEGFPLEQICVAFKARQKKVYAGFLNQGQWTDQCLTFEDLREEAKRRGWQHQFGTAWPEVWGTDPQKMGRHFEDTLTPFSFLKISDKSIVYKEKLNKNIILNYLQPLADIAVPSRSI